MIKGCQIYLKLYDNLMDNYQNIVFTKDTIFKVREDNVNEYNEKLLVITNMVIHLLTIVQRNWQIV